jgi:phage gp16-like protein
MSINQRGLAQVHIAAKELGMDDDTYRALLARVAGVRSAKQLNARQLKQVLDEFRRLGWVPKPGKKAGRKKPRTPPSRKAVMDKVEALLAEAGRPWAYADGMAQRMFQVDRVDWLEDDQLFRLMQGLLVDARRHGRRING